jgi:hypothetical protein
MKIFNCVQEICEITPIEILQNMKSVDVISVEQLLEDNCFYDVISMQTADFYIKKNISIVICRSHAERNKKIIKRNYFLLLFQYNAIKIIHPASKKKSFVFFCVYYRGFAYLILNQTIFSQSC